MKNKQYRTLSDIPILSEEGKIEGHACIFGEWSQVMYDQLKKRYFIEQISPTAITPETLANSDIIATIEHDKKLLLARSNKGEGSLTLSLDSKGLLYSFISPDSDLGKRAYEAVKRRDYVGCSFAFLVEEQEERFNENTRIWEYTITKISQLFDVALTATPAYTDTDVSARSQEKEETQEEPTEENQAEKPNEKSNTIEKMDVKKQETTVEQVEVTVEERSIEQPKVETETPKVEVQVKQRAVNTLSLFDEPKEHENVRKIRSAYQSNAPIQFRANELKISNIKAGTADVRSNTILAVCDNYALPRLPIKKEYIPQGKTPNWMLLSGGEAHALNELAKTSNSAYSATPFVGAPRRVQTQFEISAEALQMINQEDYNGILELASASIWEKLDSLAFDYESGETLIKSLIDSTNGTALSNPNWTDIVSLRSKVRTKKLSHRENDCAFVVSPEMFDTLLTTPIDAGSGKFAIEYRNGVPYFGQNQVIECPFLPDKVSVIYGNFRYCGLAQYGDITINIDATSAEVFSRGVANVGVRGMFYLTPFTPDAFAYFRSE